MPKLSAGRSKQTVLGQGRFLRLVDDDGWEFAERSRCDGVVAIVAITNNRHLLLTEQYRQAVRASVIDIPAGLAGDTDELAGEDLVTAAARELEEETGYRAESWEFVARLPTSPGLSSEVVTIYWAHSLQQRGPGGGTPGESITVHAVSLDEITEWLRNQATNGKLIDPKVYAALWLCGSPALQPPTDS